MGIEARAHRLPAFREVQRLGPRLPRAPRTPHIPHPKALVAAVTLALVGAAATLGAPSKENTQTASNPQRAPVPAELMRFPWDERIQLLRISLDASGKPVEEFATVPQILRAKSAEGETYYVPVLGEPYGEDIPENQFGHIKIITLNEVMRGGALLRESYSNGDPKKGPDGEFIYTTPDSVLNLIIPEQVPEPVLA